MPQEQQDLINQVVDRVNDFNRRVRGIEEKIRNLNARVGTLDDTVMNKTKNLNNDIQEIEDEITELRDRIANMEVDIKELNRDKKKYITQQEIEEIENYMDLMNPINSNFVTKKQVNEMIEDKETIGRKEIEQIIDNKLKKQQTENNNL